MLSIKSLKGLTSTLNALGTQRYHMMGIRSEVPHSTLADANATRPWQIYHELTMVLIDEARKLYHQDSVLWKRNISMDEYGTRMQPCGNMNSEEGFAKPSRNQMEGIYNSGI